MRRSIGAQLLEYVRRQGQVLLDRLRELLHGFFIVAGTNAEVVTGGVVKPGRQADFEMTRSGV